MKKNFLSLCLTFQLLFNPLLAQKNQENSGSFNIRELALPSEVQKLGKSSGSIYYNPSVKGKVLIPVNIWGSVTKSGLHFVPIDTNLVQGLSMAGGPSNSANLSKVKLSRNVEGKINEFEYNLTKGGDEKAFLEKLQPGDTVFVEKDQFFENRSYYTSLAGVIATVLSSILLYREVKK